MVVGHEERGHRGIGLPDWHRQLVSERLTEYHKDPKAGRAWREVRDELLSELSGHKRKR